MEVCLIVLRRASCDDSIMGLVVGRVIASRISSIFIPLARCSISPLRRLQQFTLHERPKKFEVELRFMQIE